VKRLRPYLGVVVGLVLLIALIAQVNFAQLVQTLATGGHDLLWLIPYRSLFFFLYAFGWLLLLRPADPERRASLGYLFWVTTVREAVDRLLPVASVGGSVIGVRLLRWKRLAVAPVSASVIIEIVVTLVASYVFTALGLALLVRFDWGHQFRQILIVFLATLPVPIVTVLLLRFGGVFKRLHAFLPRLIGDRISPAAAASVDVELLASLRRKSTLTTVALLQLGALVSGAFEVWFALRLFGHPISAGSAMALESMTQAVRHVAFMIPGGLGVQEAGLVFFGQLLGIGGEMALAVSMAKRLREVTWGLPALLSWQWAEGRRIHRMVPDETEC
jgi:putative membrane protein